MFGFGRPRRRGSWALRLALRSVILCAVAIVAATIVQSAALPKLTPELKALGPQASTALRFLQLFDGKLAYVPLPGLFLGLAAVILRPVRPILAGLATAASLAAIAIVVGSLALALVPMYQVPKELMQ